MKHLFIFAFFIISSTTALCQITFSTLKHNFGEIEGYDNRFVDIVVQNPTQKDGFILSVRKPSEVIYIQTQAQILKGSNITLRFSVNPMQKGKFNYTVDIYTSDKAEPHKLILQGNLLELDDPNKNSLTSCPDFNAHPAGKNPNQFDLTVITIDATTRQEIEGVQVNMIQGGQSAWVEKTDKIGKIKKPVTIGLAYFQATHKNYQAQEKGAFVSNDRNRIVIELTSNQTNPATEIELITQQETPATPTTDTEEIPLQETVTAENIALSSLDSSNFDPQFFKPVNIVFVLDVSSSMNQGDKMELMKYSLNQLSEMIRATDRISIVTYSSRAQVLLPPTSGQEKNAVNDQVKGLRASGMTAGGDGIKVGFDQAKQAFLKDGINHVFVLTDGAFNQSNYDYKKLIKKCVQGGIKLSVVGIKNDQKSELSMREIAAYGHGAYVPIFNLRDAEQNIRQAVRKMAFDK